MDLLARVFGAALARLATVAAAPGDTEETRLTKALGFLTVLFLLPALGQAADTGSGTIVHP